MRHLLTGIIMILAAIAFPAGASAQIIAVDDQQEFVDSLKHELDFGPFFGLYKDNYFTVGSTLGHKPTKTNSDVKFQISLAIRLTNATLPWNTFLFLMYTQKTFWNVFENSMPMRDLNFNPGIGISKPFFSKDRYLGKMTLLIEHESNGRDSIQSRSWNRISLSGSAMICDWLMVHAKFWIPIIDGMNNKDILNYAGIWQTGVQVSTFNKRFTWALTLVKRKGWNLNFNTILDFSWLVNRKSNLNLFLQYYNGYGENLLDYNVFHSRLRAGIVFKPKFFSEF
jgi:outer membrane phospholipase A